MADSLANKEEYKEFIDYLDSPEGRIARLNYEVKHIKRTMEEMQKTIEDMQKEVYRIMHG